MPFDLSDTIRISDGLWSADFMSFLAVACYLGMILHSANMQVPTQHQRRGQVRCQCTTLAVLVMQLQSGHWLTTGRLQMAGSAHLESGVLDVLCSRKVAGGSVLLGSAMLLLPPPLLVPAFPAISSRLLCLLLP